jgi:tetratricopeptide (TPR) repeat protein
MLSLILSAATLIPVSVSGPAALAAPPLRTTEDLESIDAEYGKAFATWEEACAGVRSKRNRPPHPAIDFFPRYRALAEGGTAAAIPWVVDHAKQAGVKLVERRKLIPTLLKRAFENHADESWMEQALFALAESRKLVDRETAIGWCTALADTSPHDSVRAASTYSWAEILANGGRTRDAGLMEEALELLRRTAREFPGTEGAGLALTIVFERLDEDWRDAQRAGAEPIEAGAPGQPVDVTRSFWGRFADLADWGSGPARLWMLMHIQASGLDGSESKKLKVSTMESLTASFPDEPWMLEFAAAAGDIGKPDALLETCTILSHWADNVQSRETQARIFLGLARAHFEAGQKNMAIDLLKKIQRYHADTELAWEAKDMMQTYTAPRVGEEAPGFTTTDVDGNELTLSDQRGKVVLLDFWGFW